MRKSSLFLNVALVISLTFSQGWHWIDVNGDKLSECYYFDENGALFTGMVTPDGWTVDTAGAWVENGVVQTKEVEAVAPSPDEVCLPKTDQLALDEWEATGGTGFQLQVE